MIKIENYVLFIRTTHTSNVRFDQLDYTRGGKKKQKNAFKRYLN